jgi:hypothetical protein
MPSSPPVLLPSTPMASRTLTRRPETMESIHTAATELLSQTLIRLPSWTSPPSTPQRLTCYWPHRNCSHTNHNCSRINKKAIPLSWLILLIHRLCSLDSPATSPSQSLLPTTIPTNLATPETNQARRHNLWALNHHPQIHWRRTRVNSASCQLNLEKQAHIPAAPPWCHAV